MNVKRTYIIRYLSFAAALGIMLLIFLMSSQDAAQSSGTSRGFIRSIAPFIKNNYKSLSPIEQDEFVASLQFIVRKGAHFLVYTLLGVLVSMGVFTYDSLKKTLKTALSFAVCALYAVSDEIHQYFVPGRSCELRDMIIDWSGTLLGCLAVLLIYTLIKRKRACRN